MSELVDIRSYCDDIHDEGGKVCIYKLSPTIYQVVGFMQSSRWGYFIEWDDYFPSEKEAYNRFFDILKNEFF